MIGAFFLFKAAEVQAQQSSFVDSLFAIETVPEFPRPGETTTAEIKTFSLDLDRADISWYINGKLQKSAIGERRFSFTMVPLGQTLSLDVAIKPFEGGLITKNFTMRPGAVEILWEASGYVPPFYKGRGLFVNEGGLRAAASPHMTDLNGKVVPAKNLVYKWKVNNNVLVESSGYGKSSIVIGESTRFRATTIEVEVRTVDGSSIAVASETLEPQSPQAVLYEESPLYGILYNSALTGEFDLREVELKMTAVPYFFSTSPTEKNLTYVWRVDGTELIGKAQEGSIAVRRPSDARINSPVDLFIKHATKPFQSAQTAFTIKFGR